MFMCCSSREKSCLIIFNLRLMPFWKDIFCSNWFFGSYVAAGQYIFFLALCLVIAGCQSSGDPHPGVDLIWEIDPNPPSVGLATINIILTDSTEQQLSGAEIILEGNMSHPGMQPVHAEMEEVEPGKYSASVEFTMGGDWFFLVESTLPDNRVLERQINVPGVRSQ